MPLLASVDLEDEFVKVDRLCLARLRGDARELTDTRERVDE